MTLPVGGIELTIGTDGVRHGVAEFQRGTQQVRAAAQQIQAEMQGLAADAKAWADAERRAAAEVSGVLAKLERDYQHNAAVIKESVARGLLSPEDARRLGAENAKAFNDGLIQELDKLGAAGVVTGKGGDARYLALASSFKSVGTAAKEASATATPALGKINSAVQGLALSAAGVPGPVGQVAKAVGAFALGGAGGLAVVGLTAIVALIQKMRDEAAAAKRPLEEMIQRAEALRQQRADDSGATLGFDIQKARQAEAIAKGTFDRLQAGADELRKSMKELPFQLRDALAAAGRALDDASGRVALLEDERRRRNEDEKRKRDKEYNDRKRQLQELADLELQASGASASDIRAREIERQIQSADRLTKAEKERLRVALETVDAIKQQQAATQAFLATMEKFRTAPTPTVLPLGQSARPGLLSGGLTLQGSNIENLDAALQRLRDTSGQTAKLIEKLGEARAKEVLATKDAYDQVTNIVGALGLLPRELQSAAAGIGELYLSIQSGDALGAISGITSFVTSIIGSGDAAREAALAAQEAARAYRAAVEDFKSGGTRRSSFDQQRRDLEESAQRLVEQFISDLKDLGYKLSPEFVNFLKTATVDQIEDYAKKYGGLFQLLFDDIFGPLKERRAELEAQIAAAKAAFDQDLAVRRLAATGYTAEADALRRQIDHEKELSDARANGFEDYQIEELKRVQGLEDEADAIRKANEEAKQRAEIALTLTQRELQARNALGENLAAEIRAAAKQAEIDSARRSGYTEEEIARLEYIQGLEDLADAYAEVAAAAKFNTGFFQDLTAEFLDLTDSPEAKAYARELRNNREIQQAIANGASDANIEFLKYIQGLREEKEQREALIKTQEEQARLFKEEANARASLNERNLRAAGQSGAADEFAFYERQRREREDAISKGYSASYLAELDRTQAAERAFRQSENSRLQQEAFDRAFSTAAPSFVGDTNASVNLAVGASASEINRLSGVNSAMLTIQQRYLPRLDYLVSIDRRLAVIAGQPDPSDALLTDLIDSERAIGLNPGNV